MPPAWSRWSVCWRHVRSSSDTVALWEGGIRCSDYCLWSAEAYSTGSRGLSWELHFVCRPWCWLRSFQGEKKNCCRENLINWRHSSVLDKVASTTLSWRNPVSYMKPMFTLYKRSCVTYTYPLKAFNRSLKLEKIPLWADMTDSGKGVLRSIVELGLL